jgi:dihydrofolate reductase
MSHKIILIAAVDRNWAIGKNGGLIYNVPTDMQFFREQTMGNIIIYGFKTLESFPQRKILPGRDNIVLTSKMIACEDPRMYVAHCISDVAHIINSFDDDRPVFICGGASVYEQFADIADEAYITKIAAETPDADAYFPNLDKLPNWEKRATVVTMTDRESGLDLQFERYCRSDEPFRHPKDN